MDKVLGQEYGNIAERTAFLRDNCDAVEELGYVKPLASEQIEELKDKLVENNTNCVMSAQTNGRRTSSTTSRLSSWRKKTTG